MRAGGARAEKPGLRIQVILLIARAGLHAYTFRDNYVIYRAAQREPRARLRRVAEVTSLACSNIVAIMKLDVSNLREVMLYLWRDAGTRRAGDAARRDRKISENASAGAGEIQAEIESLSRGFLFPSHVKLGFFIAKLRRTERCFPGSASSRYRRKRV